MDEWCIDGIFLVHVFTKVVGKLTFFSFPFLALISVFDLELFFPQPPSNFFSFWNFPRTHLFSLTYPIHPHLPTHLYI